MREGELKATCPTCRKSVVRSPRRQAPYFPFCSERCKLIDLGKWFEGEHRISEPLEPGGEDPESDAPA